MSTVLFVATSSNANSGGGRTRIVDVAREVQKRNFAAYIVCFVYATQWLSGPRFLAKGRARLSAESGFPVIYLPLLPFGRLIPVAWLNGWLAGLLLAFVAWRVQASVLFGHGTKAGYLGLLARKLRPSLKIVSDIQGAVVDEYLYERGALVSDSVSLRMEQEELSTLAASDGVIFVSQAMRNHYEKRFSRSFSSSVIIPCAARAGFIPDLARRQALRREQGLDEKFVVCYVGAAETYQLPEAMCRLFKEIQAYLPNAFFLVYSYQASVFEKYLNLEAVLSDNYKLTSVSHDQIFDHLQMGDVGLLLRDDSPVNLVASPLKFAEYCLCGLPVITTPYVGDFSRMVADNQLGHWVDLDMETISPALLEFLQDVSAHRVEYFQRCSEFARKNLTWETHGSSLENLLLSLGSKT